MNIYFDTEFTGLRKDTSLVSIGMIDENDRSIYIECDDFDRTYDDPWFKENVYKHLLLSQYETYSFNKRYYDMKKETDVYICNHIYAKKKLTEWLLEYKDVQLVSDVCHYDMVLFIDIFGTAFNIPHMISPVCHDINYDISSFYSVTEKRAFEYSREAIVKELYGKDYYIKGMKHNSLYDAKVIKAIYEGINKNK